MHHYNYSWLFFNGTLDVVKKTFISLCIWEGTAGRLVYHYENDLTSKENKWDVFNRKLTTRNIVTITFDVANQNVIFLEKAACGGLCLDTHA